MASSAANLNTGVCNPPLIKPTRQRHQCLLLSSYKVHTQTHISAKPGSLAGRTLVSPPPPHTHPHPPSLPHTCLLLCDETFKNGEGITHAPAPQGEHVHVCVCVCACLYTPVSWCLYVATYGVCASVLLLSDIRLSHRRCVCVFVCVCQVETVPGPYFVAPDNTHPHTHTHRRLAEVQHPCTLAAVDLLLGPEWASMVYTYSYTQLWGKRRKGSIFFLLNQAKKKLYLFGKHKKKSLHLSVSCVFPFAFICLDVPVLLLHLFHLQPHPFSTPPPPAAPPPARG